MLRMTPLGFGRCDGADLKIFVILSGAQRQSKDARLPER
jgi:hypothetical protein